MASTDGWRLFVDRAAGYGWMAEYARHRRPEAFAEYRRLQWEAMEQLAAWVDAYGDPWSGAEPPDGAMAAAEPSVDGIGNRIIPARWTGTGDEVEAKLNLAELPRVRFVHAVAGMDAADLLLDGRPIFSDVPYGEMTPAVSLPYPGIVEAELVASEENGVIRGIEGSPLGTGGYRDGRDGASDTTGSSGMRGGRETSGAPNQIDAEDQKKRGFAPDYDRGETAFQSQGRSGRAAIRLALRQGDTATLAAWGPANAPELAVLPSEPTVATRQPPAYARLRFANIAAGMPALDLAAAGVAPPLHVGVGTGRLTPYARLRPGAYVWEARLSGAESTLANTPPLYYPAGVAVTLLAVGSPPVSLVVARDE